MTAHPCPVCGFEQNEPPYNGREASFGICPSCGTQFGYDDTTTSHDELRNAWIAAGMPWTSRAAGPPHGWSPQTQLARVLEAAE